MVFWKPKALSIVGPQEALPEMQHVPMGPDLSNGGSHDAWGRKAPVFPQLWDGPIPEKKTQTDNSEFGI